MMSPTSRRAGFWAAALLVCSAGCAQLQFQRAGTAKAAKAAAKGAAPRALPRAPVDPEAQKRAYGKAMKLFTEESYTDAKQAFTEVVRLGPDTELGQKARANLKKVEQMLKSLREIEGK